MDAHLEAELCRVLGISGVGRVERIQSLWSGCGQVARVWVEGRATEGPGEQSVVIKHVRMPTRIEHPWGWNTDRSAQRKVRSYDVEMYWYAKYSGRCGSAAGGCRTPEYLGHTTWGDERLLVMEDIDAGGFALRKTSVSAEELDTCIRWLAAFHAEFMGERPSGLWDKGTYWHLETRPDEYAAMDDGPLKRAAHEIDRALDESVYQTIVHGDAKLANFCFAEDGGVAAVDFQYVGGGCGIKDLAYLIGGSLDSEDCFTLEARVLETYFAALRYALSTRGSKVDMDTLEDDWRKLYPYAWADFERFLKGWSPGHWKISAYSEHMTDQALAQCTT